MRKEFRVGKPVKRATLYASALGNYEMSINGKSVGDDFFAPGWTDYRIRVYYNTYDVTAMVKKGENAIGGILADAIPRSYSGGTLELECLDYLMQSKNLILKNM